MEDVAFGHSAALATAQSIKPVGWSDLRGWLRLVEAAGQIKHIDAAVDPDEELAAITFMAARTPASPALMFNNFVGNLATRASCRTCSAPARNAMRLPSGSIRSSALRT